MPDPTPIPTPTPPPAPKRTRAQINQGWVLSLTEASQIVASAQKPAYLPLFTTGGIDAAKLTALEADIQNAKTLASTAVQATTSKEGATETEVDLMENLIALLQEVQKRAKQKYAATTPTVLKDYAVGENWYASRPILEQTGTLILSKLAKDTLPGIDAAKTAQIQKALDDYKAVQTDQVGGQSDATTARATLEAAVRDVIARRREIQFAADAQWPHTDKANAGIRAEFKLPPNKAMK